MHVTFKESNYYFFKYYASKRNAYPLKCLIFMFRRGHKSQLLLLKLIFITQKLQNSCKTNKQKDIAFIHIVFSSTASK